MAPAPYFRAKLAWILGGLTILTSCRAVIDIETNEADLDCKVLMEDAYCIKVRTAEIASVTDLVFNQDKILTNESSFNLSWTMPETAKRILATKVMLASDATCTKEAMAAELEIKELKTKFSDIKDGIYYGCVFAKAKSAGLVAAKNNGIRIVVETAAPKIESKAQTLYTSGRSIAENLSISAISTLTYAWGQIAGPGTLTFSNPSAAAPTFKASVEGRYFVTLTVTNEVGTKTVKSLTIVYDVTPPVLKAIAPIITSADRVAIKATSEEDLSSYRWEIISAPDETIPELKDANTATAELSLPKLGDYSLKVSLTDEAGNIGSTTVKISKLLATAVELDTTKPTAPAAITVPSFHKATSVIATITPGTDVNFSTHNVKACTAIDCTTGCLAPTTALASPVTVSSLVNGTTYWICLQAVDLAANLSVYVASGNNVTIDTTLPSAPSSLTVPAYSNSTSVNAAFSIGTDANMSTHNFKACTAINCSIGCLSTVETPTSPAALTGLVNGTAYYACGQSVDLAGNVSSFSFTPATVTIDTTAPTSPTAVSVPVGSTSNFDITFTGGTELNPAAFNIKACEMSDCTSCVGATTAASSPGTISSSALTLGTFYYGCVQGVDLAGNTSTFVASAARVLYNSFAVTYNGNSSTSGSVPTDATGYAYGATVTVLANPGSLIKSGYTFGGWNAVQNSGTSTASFTISRNTTLYAQWTVDCGSLSGGTYVMVPGNSIYGTSSFCVQKYAASDVGGVPTSQTGTTPWVNINQTASIAKCAALGAGYHAITNPEWMSIAANLANVGSNWSMGTVGSGTLRRGHSDSDPNNACAADASDANAYVETDCTGTSSGTFVQRRTSTLSNSVVVWDIGGNVRNWVNYINFADKPTPATNNWYEFTAISGSTTTPKSHLIPLNSAQSWWSDSWNSAQGIGQIHPGSNGGGGSLHRGGRWEDGAIAGPFRLSLREDAADTSTSIAFRCAYTPNTFALTYDPNSGTSGSPPNDPTLYASGNTVTVQNNPMTLAKTGNTFAGWNTLANGTGTNYTPGSTFTIAANTILYARWIDCSSLAGGTWVAVPGDSIYGTNAFCVQKYAPSVGSSPISQTGTAPWVNINQTDSIAACVSLGAGFHLITNPEWMSIAANLANVGSNWSGGTVGSGTLRSGHIDFNPNNACAADANDANAYVETDCTGTNSGTFTQRRTSTLSNGSVVWDIGGNVRQWVNYNNSADKPTPATFAYYEFTAISGSTTTPKSHLVPLNSAQSWWSDSWSSTQGIGRIKPGTNDTGGALLRGQNWNGSADPGPFSADLSYTAPSNSAGFGFRCTYSP